jgi:hypothetical protein
MLVCISLNITSRIYGSVTNNNGFWIGWLDLLASSCTISPNHNQLQQLTIIDYLSLSPFSFSFYDWLVRASELLMTGGLPPISSSWRQAPWEPRQELFFPKWSIAVIVLMYHPLWREDCLPLMNMLGLSSSVHFTHIACYWKCLPFVLHTSPMSVQALQSRSCLYYISYATTAA